MFPNSTNKRHGSLTMAFVSVNKQSGFLMPVALFIIIVLGAMAILVSKKVSESASSYVSAGLSTQTFYAAESGAQAGLNALYFLDNDRQLVDGRCAAMAISETLSAIGLENCTVAVSCTCHYQNGNSCDSTNSANYLGLTGVTNSFYTISSRAQCGVEPTLSHHRIEVGASL
ncbi:pilus assembly PilX N-terminal domain-containing protein [Eionea flava]